MCRLTGNETLLHSWESLEGSIRMSIMFAGLEKGVRNMSVDRHHDIVAAIETGDASLARKTIREHMDVAADEPASGLAGALSSPRSRRRRC